MLNKSKVGFLAVSALFSVSVVAQDGGHHHRGFYVDLNGLVSPSTADQATAQEQTVYAEFCKGDNYQAAGLDCTLTKLSDDKPTFVKFSGKEAVLKSIKVKNGKDSLVSEDEADLDGRHYSDVINFAKPVDGCDIDLTNRVSSRIHGTGYPMLELVFNDDTTKESAEALNLVGCSNSFFYWPDHHAE